MRISPGENHGFWVNAASSEFLEPCKAAVWEELSACSTLLNTAVPPACTLPAGLKGASILCIGCEVLACMCTLQFHFEEQTQGVRASSEGWQRLGKQSPCKP